jgi:hypothetical protein
MCEEEEAVANTYIPRKDKTKKGNGARRAVRQRHTIGSSCTANATPDSIQGDMCRQQSQCRDQCEREGQAERVVTYAVFRKTLRNIFWL